SRRIHHVFEGKGRVQKLSRPVKLRDLGLLYVGIGGSIDQREDGVKLGLQIFVQILDLDAVIGAKNLPFVGFVGFIFLRTGGKNDQSNQETVQLEFHILRIGPAMTRSTVARTRKFAQK